MPKSSKLSQKELDDAFESFLKESVSDDSLDSARLNKLFQKAKEGSKKKKKGDSTWWMKKSTSEDEDDVDQEKVTPLSSKWMKPKKQSTPLLQVQEEEEDKDMDEDTSDAARTTELTEKNQKSDDTSTLMKKYSEKINPSKESTYSDSMDDSSGLASRGGPGAETLEEMEDKARFFKQLEEKHGGGDIDYAALNRDVDNGSTMKTLPTGFMGTADDFSSPVPRRPPAGNKDLSDTESDGITALNPKAKGGEAKGDMLGKVSLMETGDSTLNISRKPGKLKEIMEGKKPILERVDSDDKASNFIGTETTSDMEALHAAMREAAETPTLSFRSKDLNSTDPKHGMYDSKGVESDLKPGETQKRSERTVDDIIKEVMAEKLRKDAEEEEKRRKAEENRNNSGNQSRGGVDKEDGRGFSLSPAFNPVQSQTEGSPDLEQSQSEGSPSHQRTRQGLSGRAESIDSENHLESEADRLYRREMLEANDILSTDGRKFDLQETDGTGQVIRSPDNEVTDDARGFDLQPAVLSDMRGFDLAPAAIPEESTRGRHLSADDEKSVSFKDGRSKKGMGKNSGNKKKTKFSGVKSSGYGPKRKQPPKGCVWSPADKVLQQKTGFEKKGSDTQVLSNQLLKSVESFATYIQENYADQRKLTPPPELKFSQDEPVLSSSLRDSRVQTLSRERALVAEVNEWQNQWKDERRLNAKLKAEISALQREHTRKVEELRLEHEKELHKLKQDNFVLLAKVNSQDDASAAKKRLQTSSALGEDVTHEERALLMQKELMEQETLLQGYQQENERLYKEVKKLQEENKQNEEKMFKENQRLHTQVGNLREVIEGKDLALRNKGIITGERAQAEIAAGNTAVLGAGRIAELQSEVTESEIQQSQLKHKLRLLEQTNHELQGHVDQLVREKKHLTEKIQASKEVKQTEFQDIKLQHQREIEGLQRKLKWYAENQQLLDKDSVALREKDETISRLKEELEKTSKQVGNKLTEAQKRAKERAADAKKIQDLERQVKEMNEIIRRRHPNSIPALIFAAAASSTEHPTGPHSADSPIKSHSSAFLEEKVKRLEAELDRKDEEVKRSLRAVEQKHNSVKIQYEERIKELENETQHAKESSHPHSTVSALEKELQGAKERFSKEMEILKNENNRLQTALSQRRKDENNREVKNNAMKEQKEKMEALQRDLESKEQEIEMLKSSCDKLLQEKLQAWSERESQKDKVSKKTKKLPNTLEKEVESKIYEPQNFAGSHISDVLLENEQLKRQIEVHNLEIEQQRVRQQASLAEAESALRQAQEQRKEECALLKEKHKSEMEKVLAEKALAVADTDSARLKRELESQKLMVKHLQDQLTEAQVTTDQLAALKVKEQLYKTQMEQLRGELEEAKKNHTPEMRHFEALQAKIIGLENRRTQRESDLERMVEKAAQAATMEKNKEIQQYRDLVLRKNLEIDKFRAELDAILDVLRELQRQGVVLPSSRQTAKGLL